MTLDLGHNRERKGSMGETVLLMYGGCACMSILLIWYKIKRLKVP